MVWGHVFLRKSELRITLFAIQDGHTALRTASFNGHHKVVELLLGAGANPDLLIKVTTQQDSGVHSNLSSVHLVKPGVLNNLLFTCLYAYYPDSVYLTNTGTCPLVCIHTTTHPHAAHKCVYSHTTTTHTHTCTTMYTQDGLSPLIVASQEGHDKIVEKLLQAGTTVDLQNEVENCYYSCSSFTSGVPCAVFIVH